MTDDARPNPDALLASLNSKARRRVAESSRSSLGCVPVWARPTRCCRRRAKLAQGVEVVAGVVETHGRAESNGLLEGIRFCRVQIPYRGTTLEEMDLDAILTWRPSLGSSMSSRTPTRPAVVIQNATRTCSSCSMRGLTFIRRSTFSTSRVGMHRPTDYRNYGARNRPRSILTRPMKLH